MVVVIADALYISHINHFLGFLSILLIVTIIKKQPFVFEPDVAFLPVCHTEVSGSSFFQNPTGHLEISIILLIGGNNNSLLLFDISSMEILSRRRMIFLQKCRRVGFQVRDLVYHVLGGFELAIIGFTRTLRRIKPRFYIIFFPLVRINNALKFTASPTSEAARREDFFLLLLNSLIDPTQPNIVLLRFV